MADMLHIINKSPFNSPALADCLRFIGEQDVILLLEDGVYAGITPDYLTDATVVYALKEDIATRGLTDKLMCTIKQIDYTGFVELTLEHSAIQSWP